MLPRNHPDRIRIAFDDHRLVAAGLILPATLAQHLGLPQLVDRRLDLGRAPGRGNTGDKMMPLVASALAGGDCIDDADVLRTGGTACAPGGRPVPWVARSRRHPRWVPSCAASGGARTGEEHERTHGAGAALRGLASLDEAVREAGLLRRYYSRQSALHGECFYNGLCDPIEDTERRVRETSDYIEDAERLADST